MTKLSNLELCQTVPYEALNGYLVIDLSDRLAGSFCAKTLGLYGSEVVKIEPLEGDPLRQLGQTEDGPDERDSPLFLHLNVGKKSLTLNLETAEGKEILGASGLPVVFADTLTEAADAIKKLRVN